MQQVVDLILKNKETKKETTIYCFNDLTYDPHFNLLHISSHGFMTTIKNIENYEMQLKYRFIDNREDEITTEKQ